MEKIPEYAYVVLKRIKNAGYDAYIVGGAVRDLYLRRPIHDIDINTNMLPDQIKEMFSDFELSMRGEKHGTITIMVDNKYNRVEVTTYKIDGEYSNATHPEYPNLNADLVTDLSRRDYTMNAMCYDGRGGYIDPLNARKDIDDKIIRVLGEGTERFDEDPIRIMRGIRFVAQLGFKLDSNTKKVMMLAKDKLNEVGSERIDYEFFDIIRGEYSELAIKYMLECDILSEHINKLTQEELDVYTQATSFHLRLYLLLKDKYNDEDNIFAIGKKRSFVLKRLEENIEKYQKGLPFDRDKLKGIIHKNGVDNVIRLAQYLVITNVQSEIILNMIDEVRYNWSRYGSSSSNYNIVNINKYLEYNNEELDITKEKLLEKTNVTQENVDEIYDYLFNCIRCKNFMNTEKELILRANKRIEKLNIAKTNKENILNQLK